MAAILPRRPAAVSLNESRSGDDMVAPGKSFSQKCRTKRRHRRATPLSRDEVIQLTVHLSCHAGRPTDLGFTRDRRLTRPSRLKPTWVGRSGTQLSPHARAEGWVPALASLGRDDTGSGGAATPPRAGASRAADA